MKKLLFLALLLSFPVSAATFVVAAFIPPSGTVYLGRLGLEPNEAFSMPVQWESETEVSLSLLTSPSGLVLSNNALTWTPADEGVYEVCIKAVGADGQEFHGIWIFEVKRKYKPPRIKPLWEIASDIDENWLQS